MTPVAVDYEVFYSKKLKYTLRTQIAEEFCRSDLFDCYLISVSDGKNCWSGHPKDFNYAALDGRPLISHNSYWDNTCHNELVRRGLAPKLTIPSWSCTANMTAYLCNRRALADAAEFLLGVRPDKSYRDTAEGRHWNDFSEMEKQQIIQAGRVDAHTCWTLWDRFSAQWPEMERCLSKLTIDQGMRGVQIDVALLNHYLLCTFDAKAATEKLIPWIQEADESDWDGFNTKPTSTKCIAEQCRRSKIPCPPTKSDDEEGYEEWEAQFGPANPWIAAVSAWRSVNKLLKTFQTVKRRLRSDGTLPFALKYFGAHTGRWSGDAGVNFQNMRKKPLLITTSGMMEADELKISAAMDEHDETEKWPEWVKEAIDFRALVIPRPGKKMIVSDLAQIEPRVLAWLGGNHALLKMISDGFGVYESFARTSMGFNEPKMDKKSDYYKMTKIQVLGLGYGAGWEKFITIAQQGGVDITKDDPEFEEIQEIDYVTGETVIKKRPGYGKNSRAIVKNFRDKNKCITDLWKRMDDGVKSSVGSDFVVTLPSGRKMVYKDVKIAVRMVPDPKTGKPKRTTVVTADIGGRRVHVYGGKIVENITQAAARDVFGAQLIRMRDVDLDILFSSHDEAILEVDQQVTAKDIEKQMSYCPDWLKGCPIAAEAKEVSHYLK